MARRKPVPLPPIVINMSRPCKNGQPYVADDGSCLRCGAAQGVHGYACQDGHEIAIQKAMAELGLASTEGEDYAEDDGLIGIDELIGCVRRNM